MFKKVVENFTCEHCDHFVQGSGYTNHCPSCLWSKHVDNDPGDRASDCGGLMEPVDCSYTSSEQWILHRCLVCGHEKRNKIQKEDAVDGLTRLFRARERSLR